jgi:hypothetical protein
MRFHLPPRPSSVLVSVLAAGLMLTAASCSHITPLGPDAMPQPHHLRSPLVLQSMRSQCFGCYGPKTGAPVTITSAGVSQVYPFRPPSPPGPGQQAVPVEYGFWITVPAAEVPAVATVIPADSGTPGPPTASAVTGADTTPAISVDGRTWVLVGSNTTRFADREFEVFLSSRNQALQLQAILAASG